MKSIFFALVAVALVAAVSASDADPAIDVAHVELVNAMHAAGETTWRATMDTKFAKMTVAEAKRLVNTQIRARHESPLVEKHLRLRDIPDSFDATQAWPSCITPIRDQGHCGSCWAHGAAEALSDRMCIASNGTTSVILSPQDLVSCDNTNYGCNGGYLDAAWQYMKSTGVVSDKCMPYTSGQAGDNGQCPHKKCTGSGMWKKYHAKTVFDVPQDEQQIQMHLMENGPLEVAFTVYQDFMSYKDGVYEHKTGNMLGGHAVKLVGWGEDNGVKYWRIANSWNTTWGMKGYFLIKRGVNECGIESNVVGGLAQVPDNMNQLRF